VECDTFGSILRVKATIPNQEADAKSKQAVRKAQIKLGVCYQPTHEGNFPYSFRLDLIGFFAVLTELKGLEPHRLLELRIHKHLAIREALGSLQLLSR
jgi:hypothetical protein